MSSNGSFKTTAYDGRYLLFSWEVSSQSIESNTTTIKWSLKGGGAGISASWYNAGPFKVVIDGNTVFSSSTRIKLYEGTLVASGVYTLTHDSSGNKSFSASAEGAIYVTTVNSKGGGSWSLPTISRASVPTISPKSFNIGDTVTINTNMTSNTFTHKITLTFKNYTYTVGSNVGASIKLNTATIANDLYKQITNESKANGTITVETFKGSTSLGTNSVTFTANANKSASPTFNATYKDTNYNTVGITGNNQLIIRNTSTLQVNITNATALYSATLKSVSVNINGNTYNKTLTSSTINIDVGVLNFSEDVTAKVTITDSRGLSTTKDININIVNWLAPTALISIERQNNYYTKTFITVNANYYDLDNKNTLTIKYRIKEKSSSSYGGYVSISNNTQSSFDADNTKEWIVQVLVSDLLGSTTYNLNLPKGMPIVFYDKVLSSVGIGCFPKDENSLEVLGKNIYKALFYSSGDVVAVKNIYAIGNVTGSKKSLDFTVQLPKSLEDIKNVTFNEIKINARHADGGYTLTDTYLKAGYDVLADSSIVVTYRINTGTNAITINLDKSSGEFNGTNNTPQTIEINSLKFTCS